jgi:glycolate oxidase iron-sulfur subunit
MSDLESARLLVSAAQEVIDAALKHAAQVTEGGAKIDDHQVHTERVAYLATQVRAELQPGMPFSRWLKRLMLGPMLAHQQWLERGLGATRLLYQRTGLQHLVRASGLLTPVPGLIRMDRFLPAIPAKPVRRSLPEVVPAIGEQRGRVGFFLGCAMNTIFADVTRRSIRVLAKLGYEVVIPRKVVCCGAPQVSLGERDLACNMARHNLACFDGLDAIITDCAACGAELKHYHELLDDATVEAFSTRVRDFAEFVAPIMPADCRQLIAPVTYHAPCHLRAQAVGFKGRDLIRRLPGVEHVTTVMECCGHNGTYAMRTTGFEASARIGSKAFDAMREAQAGVWVRIPARQAARAGVSEASRSRISSRTGAASPGRSGRQSDRPSPQRAATRAGSSPSTRR